MEKALVGTWRKKKCPMYNNDDDNDAFWFYGTIRFRENHSMAQDLSWTFCKDTCENPPSDPMKYCTCTYHVEDGKLIITPNAENPLGFGDETTAPYLTGIPIKSVTGKMLILDYWESDGVSVECTCFEKL
ncbi:MAG: hypothetical protein K9J17_03740 [Flavobacteriales bacterium]|nr:hypothetical protein [Flavobacteriales bacterium]